jgi:hypothetical protein
MDESPCLPLYVRVGGRMEGYSLCGDLLALTVSVVRQSPVPF